MWSAIGYLKAPRILRRRPKKNLRVPASRKAETRLQATPVQALRSALTAEIRHPEQAAQRLDRQTPPRIEDH